MSALEETSSGLPADPPPRDNSGRECELVDDDRGLLDHIDPCECDTHDGVCRECGFKITVGERAEYGHARANNRSPRPDGSRVDCRHRSSAVNPGEAQRWGVDE